MGRLITVRPHPFRLDRQVVQVEPGLTVAEIVERVLPAPWQPHAVVVLDGAPLDRAAWKVVPRDGQTIAITVCPGSREVLAPVLQIAVAIGAAALGQYWGTALQLGPLGKSVLSASLAAAGMLAVRALVPPPALPALGGRRRGPQSWSLAGATNDARVWSAIPRVLGEIRYVPPLAGTPIPELSGDDQHLRIALCWGYGPLEVADLRIGETPIEQYQHEHEYWPGTPGQRPVLQTWSADVAVELVDVIVRHDDPPPVRRSAPAAREIVIQLEWPRGLVDLSRGGRDALAVEYAVDTAPPGTTNWTERVRQTIRRKSTSAVRVAHRITVTDQVDVRVRRITRDRRDAAKIDEMRWAYLQTIQAGDPITAEGVAISVLRVIAGAQSSGTLGPISGVVRSIVPDYDGTEWVTRATRNPASLALAVLRGPGARRPVPDERIDLPAFVDWHHYCQTRGLTCDLVVDWDGATVGEVLDIVAACGDAIVRPIDGRWTPIIDRAQPAPVQLFTGRNTTAIQWSRSYLPIPDALRVRFLSREADYRPAEVVVWRTGTPPATGAIVDDLELQGVTDPALAIRHGRRRLAELQLRRETWTVQLGWEFLACRPGDRVAIAHDVIVVSLAAGRITALEFTLSGDVTAIEIDEPVDTTSGIAYAATIRSAGGVSTHALAAVNGTITRLPFASAIPAASAPAVGDLVVVGELGRETIPAIVARIRPGPDWTATLELVPYDERLYAEEGDLPWLESRVALGALPRPTIQAVERSGGLVTVVLSAGQPVPIGAQAVEIGWTVDAGETVEIASPDVRVIVLGGAPADRTLTVRARWRYGHGPGPWSHAIVSAPDETLAPLPPMGLAVDGQVLVWRASPTRDVVAYEIRWGHPGVAWASASQAGRVLGLAWPIARVGSGTIDLLVAAVGPGDRYSEPARITVTLPSPEARWPVATISERDRAWPGSLIGGYRLDGSIAGVASQALWLDPAEPAFRENEPAFPRARTGTRWTYRTRITIPTEVTIGGQEVPITTADQIEVVPAIDRQALRRVALVYDRDVPEIPWASGLYWASGVGWRSVGSAPWIEWPHGVGARPGEVVHVMVEGTGLLSDLEIRITRAIRRISYPAVDVPAAGTSVPIPPDGVLLIAAHATSLSTDAVLTVGRSDRSCDIRAVSLEGNPRSATADVLLEYV